MRIVLLLMLFVLITGTSSGQTNPDQLIKRFFNDYPANTGKAIDDLYATNPWTARIKDGKENIKKELNGYTVDFVGKYYGYELITKKQFAESFVLYSYLVKYDRQPMRVIFKFYKPDDKWMLYSFAIDSDLDTELQEAAKIYQLNLDKGS